MSRFLLFVLTILTTATFAEARDANHLQGARSPYLLQHLYNPVDWYPWGPEALKKARSENKLIFISVGYSSCHWCHVMEDESFENDAIAEFLNKHFVSIKIDRERRPDLDEQFMFVTQVLTGSGGWPNSVFLTPEGDPFHAGGYFPPDIFTEVLQQVQQAWQDNPEFLRTEAAKVTHAANSYLARKSEARDITPQLVEQIASSVLEQLDPFNGGFGVAPKFPRETLFLFLLDQASRSSDPHLLQAVTEMLDGMIKGGIHDQVGGGFHRYSVDPEWHVPHFEKMLYNQALTGRLLIRAWEATGRPRYRRAAERLFDYVLRDLRDPAGAFYSAQDADSLNSDGEKAEGAFYTWTPDDLQPLGSHANLIRDVFRISPEGDLDGENVLNTWGLWEELSDENEPGTQAFTANLDRLLLDMRSLRDKRPPPFLDRKIVVSWNAAMIETLAEASRRLGRPDYYQAASTAAQFILDNVQTPSGLARVWLEGSAEIAAQLPDYAGLGLALIALHDNAPDPVSAKAWLEGARKMADQTRVRFGPAENGHRMTETKDGLSELIPVDDNEIPSGNALALALYSRLAKRMQAPEIEQDAYRLAAAMSGFAADVPSQRGFTLKAVQELQNGEIGPVRYAANGAVRVELLKGQSSGTIEVIITIAEGWHINAHKPLEPFYIATSLALDDNFDPAIRYPAPLTKSLSFSDTPLALYETSVRLKAYRLVISDEIVPRKIKLTLQACSDDICLHPEDLSFVLWN